MHTPTHKYVCALVRVANVFTPTAAHASDNNTLQEPCELGVSVRHVFRPLYFVAKRAYHVAKRQQTLVYVDSFLQALALSFGLLLTLGTS